MNSHYPTQTYFRQAAELGLRQQVSRPMLIDAKIWPRVWSLLLIICFILLPVNFWLCHLLADLEQALQTEEDIRHELTETRIRLQATRDLMYSPDRIRMLASQQLSLYLPDREQVQVYR